MVSHSKAIKRHCLRSRAEEEPESQDGCRKAAELEFHLDPPLKTVLNVGFLPLNEVFMPHPLIEMSRESDRTDLSITTLRLQSQPQKSRAFCSQEPDMFASRHGRYAQSAKPGAGAGAGAENRIGVSPQTGTHPPPHSVLKHLKLNFMPGCTEIPTEPRVFTARGGDKI